METRLFTVIVFIGIMLPFLSSCRLNPSSTSYFSYQTECVNVELDGSQTVKAYGMGRGRVDAVEQAYKNAVRDVIFKGISSGSRECQSRPLMLEVNAEEKYRTYFNTFFADRSRFGNTVNYSRFVSLQDERLIQHINRRPMTQNVDQDVYSAVVRVQREALRQQLIKDGIIKQ
jgi:hypothetical protein